MTAAPSGTGLTQVQANVSGLSPGTKYHFALFLLIGAGSGSTILNGGDQTFTTSTTNGGGSGPGSSANGSLRLLSKTLTVKKGKVTIPLLCNSSKSCTGRLSITSSGKTCLRGKAFSVAAGNPKTLRPKVRAACRKLLARARRHRVGAS